MVFCVLLNPFFAPLLGIGGTQVYSPVILPVTGVGRGGIVGTYQLIGRIVLGLFVYGAPVRNSATCCKQRVTSLPFQVV
jgi:hypothetical protein